MIRDVRRGFSHVVNEFSQNYDDLFWWRNRFLHRVCGPLQRLRYGNDGIDVMAKDWDNLLVLDACRADTFQSTADFEAFDDFEVVESRASATPEWVQKNFAGKEFGNTVYVNGNPWVSRHSEGSWHELIDVWSIDFDDEHGTVMPETLSEHGLEAAERHPNKRLVLHYNQPHAPYVGQIPLEFDRGVAAGSGRALKQGLITEREFRDAYRSNLEYVLPQAIETARELPGKSVITADHGELFGKRQFPFGVTAYAHPMGIRDPDLVQVPWAVIEDEGRKELIDDGVTEAEYDEQELTDRLEDLGYV